MRILVLGAGNVGSAAAYDLSDEFDVWIGDVSEERLRAVQERLEMAGKFANTVKVDVRDFRGLVETMGKFDLVASAVPGRFGFSVLRAGIEAGVDVVDVSFMPEDPWGLHEEAESKGVALVVDAGFAPGLSHMFLGRIYSELDPLEEGIIRVGGLPRLPKEPLFYRITWSPHDLIEEYKRPARLIRDGRIVEVDPLSEIFPVELRSFEFEEFPSDGLRTALRTIKAGRLEERTLRWKGHLEKMKVLRELGFFEEENVDFTLRVIAPLMTYESPDFSIMQVIGRGRKGGKELEIEYFLYDEEDYFTSMARVTGFTLAQVVRLAAERKCTVGVIPPELIGMREDAFSFVMEGLKERGILIERREREL